ncbi:hypothetical protein [Nocardia barduliensis]|uniref:hypothetical protein n=1 Tax=Nocardia barduliensis TaxID=2736643 RepID=UPI001574D7BC|nr:hypothetical protein [Nocardia barduliensis]
MTTRTQLRKTALSLPEAVEQRTRPGVVVFAVRDRRFAASDEDGRVRLYLSGADAQEVLAAHPSAERLTRGTTSIGVVVPLSDINGQQLNHWVRRAWLSRAPKRLAAPMIAAETADVAVGDLPTAIGNPARRALAAVGITTLARVAESTEAQLLAMHGVGPKAVRVLREALRSSGRSLAE